MGLNIFPQPKNIKIIENTYQKSSNNEIIKIEDNTLANEEYRVEIKSKSIEIYASSNIGFFYGEKTVEQIKENSEGEIPCCIIEDKPTFAYRGFMLDCARHSFSLEEIKQIIDELARIKINFFHWHLTDDQGWRIAIDKYPKLIEIGSKRKPSSFDDGKSYSACFTKKELKDIVNYCSERFITVIPEFDVPGHTSALIASYPQLSCHKNQIEVKTKRGIFKDVLCVSNEETFNVVKDILDEIIEIFPSEYIHIGGDEVPKKNWQNCPCCQKAIKDNNLKDETELQAWFTKKVVNYLKSKGKKAIVWNESIKGKGLKADDIIVQRWIGKTDKTRDFANEGGLYIESDFFHYYFDYPYGFTPLKKTYEYNPYIEGLKDSKSLFGVEAPLWTEFVKDFDRAGYMLFPRLLAFCETAWNGNEKPTYLEYTDKTKTYLKHFENKKLCHAKPKEWKLSKISRAGETIKFFAQFIK